MKKLLVLSLLVIFSYQLHAQSQLFVKAGVTYSNITETDFFTPNQTKFKPGAQFGLLYSYQLKSNFNIRTELLFSDKGFKVSNAQNTDTRFRLFYINMPLLTGYQHGKFNFEIGPELGYLLTAFYQIGDQSNDVGGLFDKFELGVTAGISYMIIDKLLINFRYSRGLIPVAEFFVIDDTGFNSRQEKVYNQSFQLSMGWLLF